MKTDQQLKIVIADDDTDDLQYLDFLFKNHKKFEVIGSLTSGREALEKMEKSEDVPDVLLIDMYMPIMTGSEVAGIVLQQSKFSNLAVFIISGEINRVERSTFQRQGALY